MRDDNIPVSDSDELSVAGGRFADRTRKLGEYWPTNSPLSAAEIEQRKELMKTRRIKVPKWVPRDTENVFALTPLPEK